MPKQLLEPVEKIEIISDTSTTIETYYPVHNEVYEDEKCIFFKIADGTNWMWYKYCAKIFYCENNS